VIFLTSNVRMVNLGNGQGSFITFTRLKPLSQQGAKKSKKKLYVQYNKCFAVYELSHTKLLASSFKSANM